MQLLCTCCHQDKQSVEARTRRPAPPTAAATAPSRPWWEDGAAGAAGAAGAGMSRGTGEGGDSCFVIVVPVGKICPNLPTREDSPGSAALALSPERISAIMVSNVYFVASWTFSCACAAFLLLCFAQLAR